PQQPSSLPAVHSRQLHACPDLLAHRRRRPISIPKPPSGLHISVQTLSERHSAAAPSRSQPSPTALATVSFSVSFVVHQPIDQDIRIIRHQLHDQSLSLPPWLRFAPHHHYWDSRV